MQLRERMFEWDLSPKAMFAIVAVGVLLLLVLASPAYLFGRGTTVEVTGIVVAPFDAPSQSGDSYYMRVSVGPGTEVRVLIPRSLPVRPGKTVVLTQTTGRLGSTFYRFVRYADAGA